MLKFLGTLVVLLAMALGAIVWKAPDIVRWYVADHYPDVTLEGDIQIDWLGRKVRLFQVGYQKPNLSAWLSSVTVNTSKGVTVRGGTVQVTLDKQTKSVEPPKAPSGFQVDVFGIDLTVIRGDVKAVLAEARVDDTEVCFSKGTFSHPKIKATIEEGCVKRDRSSAEAAYVTVPFELPFEVPRVSRQQVLALTGVRATPEDRVVHFDTASFGKFKAEGPASVKVAEDTVFLDLAKVEVDHPWVAPHPVVFNEVEAVVPKNGDGVVRVSIGAADVKLHPVEHWVDGQETCSDWIDALPKPLPEAMEGMAAHFEGNLSFEVRTKPTPHLSIKQSCKYACAESPIKELSKDEFTYQVYDAQGKLVDRTTGYNSDDWTFLADLPFEVHDAFRILEDPGFYNHKGILPLALQNSLAANLEEGEFVKGGSTITMQLAKNLWLRRHKTIGRKAKEALLTLALESCFTKAQLLELYLNVVEFAPDVYGIGPAARHYFDKEAHDLSTVEAFYLARLLPHPHRSVPPKEGGLEQTKRLMHRLASSGYLAKHIAPVKEEDLDFNGWVFND